MSLEEKILRKYVRKILENMKLSKKRELKEERLLRNKIRNLIREAKEDIPHSSTGINVLRGLLKDIIKQIEMEYKKLTSSEEQRKSFRQHFLKATVNLLSPEFTFFDSDEKTTGKDVNVSLNEEIDVSLEDENEPPDQSMFIDIDGDGKADNEEQDEESPFQLIQGLDPTGRNFAMTAFDNVKEQIYDDFISLGNEEDRITFFNYLITNLKLHFDRMNDELTSTVKEPTTKEYEKEKVYQNKLETGETEDVGQPSDMESAEETPAPDESDEELDSILGKQKGAKK